mgnify:CR=1 FL=1|tara:strand:- start:213476 stop:214015 length:540 start_codon:yes stop_codon:yes gene_type:complete
MTDFEKHIRENKLLFDEHKADRSKLWANIEKELIPEQPSKVIRFWRSPFLKIAASIFIALGIYTVVDFFANQNNPQQTVANYELQEIDMHYSNLVQHQVELVQQSTKLSQEEKDEFLSFMDDLDEEYAQLKIEMGKNLANEQILEAIVNNYKKRIELMENLLDRINNSKNIDDESGYIL